MSAQLIAEIDALNEQDKFREVYDKLKKPDGNYNDMDLELMWRLARACRFLVLNNGPKDKKAKQEWITEGLDVMKTAVERFPTACLSNTWYGIMLNVKSQDEGIKNKIKLGYEIREYFDKGYEANPNDFMTLHCLGSWCFEVASLGKVERAFASTFFGKPPESSFEEALKFYLDAEKALPGRPYTVCRIAQCYDRLKNKEKAKEWAQKAIKLHAQDPEVEELQHECHRLAG
ncbi:Regulator of microtubule dynamics protein [Echinococcus granulosus]|uniref:Regulator of microtubule dynamics protein 1 n=1 Tax=Echinococcus granulosus TaxID=6210 RepID=U6J4J7_ECHGR|nr:Regulator of microtubule dynamics protein [Echinococcus granulosus]EUB64492.1 Regulator of microtubule dynamics protein [Echinococcus granulosus]CDS16653.1 regulator of microtubule dynamics protein [Echinococcus granulosus]